MTQLLNYLLMLSRTYEKVVATKVKHVVLKLSLAHVQRCSFESNLCPCGNLQCLRRGVLKFLQLHRKMPR